MMKMMMIWCCQMMQLCMMETMWTVRMMTMFVQRMGGDDEEEDN